MYMHFFLLCYINVLITFMIYFFVIYLLFILIHVMIMCMQGNPCYNVMVYSI